MQIEFGDNTYWLVAMSNRTRPHQFDGPILAAFTRLADAIGLGAINGVIDIVFVPYSAAEAATFAAECETQELVVPED